MGTVVPDEPNLLHLLPGRMRVHLPGRVGDERAALLERVRRIPGVRHVDDNVLTGNLLIQFEPGESDAPTLLAVLGARSGQTDAPVPLHGPSRDNRRTNRVREKSPRQHAEDIPWSAGTLPAQEAGQAAQRVPALPARRATSSDSRGHGLYDIDLAVQVLGLVVDVLLWESPLGLVLTALEALRLALHVVERWGSAPVIAQGQQAVQCTCCPVHGPMVA